MLSMTETDPQQRPDAPEVLRQWKEIRQRLSFLQRVARLRREQDGLTRTILLDIFSVVRICIIISRRAWRRLTAMLNLLRRFVCSC